MCTKGMNSDTIVTGCSWRDDPRFLVFIIGARTRFAVRWPPVPSRPGERRRSGPVRRSES